MTPAIPLATLRGIAAMAPRRLRRELNRVIAEILQHPPVVIYMHTDEAAPSGGRFVSDDDLSAIRTRLQNIHGTGLAVMREDAEAIAQRLGLSWEVAAGAESAPTPTEVAADRNAAESRTHWQHLPEGPQPRIDADALHRLVDASRSQLGAELTEAFRALLPPR